MVTTALAWTIPLFPFLSFAVIALGGYRKRKFSHTIALIGITFSLLISQIIFWTSISRGASLISGSETLPWLNVGTAQMGFGAYLDAKSAVMIFVVPLVCLIIFVYSIGYMHNDPQYSRFFAYVSLFAFAMLGLVIADNLLALFIFWEIMGTCSYLLIGFWYEKEKAYKAAIKAFLVTKIGDIFLLLGLVILYSEAGTLAYRQLFEPAMLQSLAQSQFFPGLSTATMVCLLLFAGTVGKSAQFPLHVWLPDAMEGPTPASALIHAATMVSAGIFLIIRMFPLLQISQALPIIAFIGTFTAIFASVIAVFQLDIKRVLAYSTISQLGYMVAAVGLGAYKASLFHLMTHTFFKALLFMAAGSVIHSVEHGHQIYRGHASRTGPDAAIFSPNDMMQMGGLLKSMPVTAIAFITGALSLAGFPLVTAGFWSKDSILTQAWFLNRSIFWILAIAAGITAFYSMRQICLVFLGKPRTQSSYFSRENGNLIIIPLLVLALFSVFAGWVGIPDGFPLLSRIIPDFFERLFESEAFSIDSLLRVEAISVVHPSSHFAWIPVLTGVAFPLLGFFTGWQLYGKIPLETGDEDPLRTLMTFFKLRWFYNFGQHKFYFDELYNIIFVNPLLWLIDGFSFIDEKLIDQIALSVSRIFVAITTTVNDVDDFVFYPDLPWIQKLTATSIVDWIDTYIIDEVVNLTGYIFSMLSGLLRQIDEELIGGFSDRIADAAYALGNYVRRLQNGLVSDYMWNAFLMILLFIAAITYLQ
ncbi:MAG: NADH-quinone oxidoreductase subunit L [Anaerolineae bacterium]|nr:NADH-quinone oxidoreductase subunit L [Anaerolineae bacterium]